MIGAGLWAALGSAAIIAIASLILFAEPPSAPRPSLMRVSVPLGHEPVPAFILLEPEKDTPCAP